LGESSVKKFGKPSSSARGAKEILEAIEEGIRFSVRTMGCFCFGGGEHGLGGSVHGAAAAG